MMPTMTVQSLSDRLVVATHNRGKVREFETLLVPFWQHFISAGDLGLVEPEETGTTFAENALLKAQAAAGKDHWTLADDSGLCVHALGNAPGIYSARWAGPEKNFQVAMQRIHDELGASADRSASFVCVLALIAPDGEAHLFEGRCVGQIIWPPRGDHGFGYDPCFVPDGDTRSFAEIPDDEKNVISHRARAVCRMVDFLKQR